MDVTQETQPEIVEQEVVQEVQQETPEVQQEVTVSEPEIVHPEPFKFTEQEPTPEQQWTPETVAQKFQDPQQQQALLKALGLDDYALGAIDYYRKTGGLAEYAEVKSVDYSKLSDEQIVERKLREQYATAGLSDEELKLLIEDEMSSRFKLDTEMYTEREVLTSKARLKAEASEFRKTLIDRQSQFKAPERQEVQPAPQLTYEQEVEINRNELLKDEGIKQFLAAKKLQYGDPQSPYNFEVQKPENTLAIMYDTNRYLSFVAKKNEQGQPILQNGKPVLDHQKLLKIASYVENMDTIEQGLINYGKTLGKKALEDEAENAVINKSNGTHSEPDDLYKALNRRLTQR